MVVAPDRNTNTTRPTRFNALHLSTRISLQINKFDTMKVYAGFVVTLLAAGLHLAVADLPYQVDNDGEFSNSVSAFHRTPNSYDGSPQE